jgi:hypothetical protein
MIKRKGKRFYLEVYNPANTWKLLGVTAVVHIPDAVNVFCTHFKRPDKHFYIKGRGYPINEELLKMLKNAGINFIIIPEDGKRGFKAYIVETCDYLAGMPVEEPLTERQRCIPLSQLVEIPVDRKQLEFFIYGDKKDDMR